MFLPHCVVFLKTTGPETGSTGVKQLVSRRRQKGYRIFGACFGGTREGFRPPAHWQITKTQKKSGKIKDWCKLVDKQEELGWLGENSEILVKILHLVCRQDGMWVRNMGEDDPELGYVYSSGT